MFQNKNNLPTPRFAKSFDKSSLVKGYVYLKRCSVHDNTVNNTVNWNHPRLNVSVPSRAINNIAGALSSAAQEGAALGYKAAHILPSSPAAKIAVGTGVYLGVQSGTAGMGKILNSFSSSNNKTQNYLNLSNTVGVNGVVGNQEQNNNNLDTIIDLTDKFNDFPLNLLPDINQLVTAELLFLLVILNVFIVQYITKIDFNKYIPDNSFGKILKLFINRYINIWSKSVKLLLIISWSGLFFCVILSKIAMYYVLTY